MLGIILLYVGAVLIINGLGVLGKISPRETAIMNIFTGVISALVCFQGAFAGGTDGQIQSCGYGLLFSLTYLWIAYNNLTSQDNRGLGWFCLFVSLTAVAITCDQFHLATKFAGKWLTVCWGAWAILWMTYFFHHVVQPIRYTKEVGIFTIVVGIFTGWIPGYLILSGHMPN